MAEYITIWPIEDRNQSTYSLCIEARSELAEMLQQANLTVAGPIAWSRDRESLSAHLHVIPEGPFLEDARPWNSRRGLADELFDQGAA